MARVSQKALRPRQYVFNRLSPERMVQLRPAVRKLRENERAALKTAQEARAATERTEAARHAQNIMAGLQTPDPESDSIRALQKELEELQEKKQLLFAQLKQSLNSADAKREVVQQPIPSLAAMQNQKTQKQPTVEKEKTKSRENENPSMSDA